MRCIDYISNRDARAAERAANLREDAERRARHEERQRQRAARRGFEVIQ